MGRVGSSVLATVSLTSSMGQSSSSSSMVEMSFSGSVGLVELVLGYGVCMFSVSMAAAGAASWILVSFLEGTIGRRFGLLLHEDGRMRVLLGFDHRL